MLRKFFRAIVKNWATRMSGPASVPAAIVAVFLSNTVAKVAFFVTAAACVLFTAFAVWRDERLEVERLQKVLEPRLTLDFEPDRAPWMVITRLTDANPQFNRVLYVRLRARATVQIANCRAILLRVMKLEHGQWVPTTLCEPLDLTWSNYPRAEDRRVRIDGGVEQCLDVCRIPQVNAILQLTTVGFAMPNHSVGIFDAPGTYRFDVGVAGDGNAHAEMSISLTTGPSWDKATVEVVHENGHFGAATLGGD